MRPSQTSSGRAWLENFGAPDVPAATMLVDSLRFVGLSTMHKGLKERLEGLAANQTIRMPALVLPERSLASAELGVPVAAALTPKSLGSSCSRTVCFGRSPRGEEANDGSSLRHSCGVLTAGGSRRLHARQCGV